MTFVKQELTCTQRAWYLRPTWLICFAWIYGTSQNLPVFYSANVVPIDYKNSTVYYCTTTQGHSLSGRIYLLASALLGFVIPLAVLTISYCRVIRVVWTRDRRLSQGFVDTESSATIKNVKLLQRWRKRVLRVLVIVVICFVACWLPFAVYHGILERYLKKFPNPMDAMRLITYSFGIVNSTCNPFIYSFNVGGKSFSSMKSRFLEVMAGRARASSQSVGRSVDLSRCTCKTELSRKMMELNFPSNNIDSLTYNALRNNYVEYPFINALPDSQEDDIDTRL